MSLKRRDKKLPIPFSCRFLVVRISFSSSSSFLSLIDSDDLCASLSLYASANWNCRRNRHTLGSLKFTVTQFPATHRVVSSVVCFVSFFLSDVIIHSTQMIPVVGRGANMIRMIPADDSPSHDSTESRRDLKLVESFFCVWRGGISFLWFHFQCAVARFLLLLVTGCLRLGIFDASLSIVSRLV